MGGVGGERGGGVERDGGRSVVGVQHGSGVEPQGSARLRGCLSLVYAVVVSNGAYVAKGGEWIDHASRFRCVAD